MKKGATAAATAKRNPNETKCENETNLWKWDEFRYDEDSHYLCFSFHLFVLPFFHAFIHSFDLSLTYSLGVFCFQFSLIERIRSDSKTLVSISCCRCRCCCYCYCCCCWTQNFVINKLAREKNHISLDWNTSETGLTSAINCNLINSNNLYSTAIYIRIRSDSKSPVGSVLVYAIGLWFEIAVKKSCLKNWINWLQQKNTVKFPWWKRKQVQKCHLMKTNSLAWILNCFCPPANHKKRNAFYAPQSVRGAEITVLFHA